MIHTDKIAILMATYNGEKYISEQIDSIINQTFREWELFIHDDGSKDQTKEIIEAYEKRNPNQIHIIHTPSTGGAKNNFMHLLSEVSAPYLMFCDQDDVWKSRKIEMTINAMKKLESEYGTDIPLMVFTELTVVDRELNVIAKKMCDYQKLNPLNQKINHLVIQNEITGCTLMINAALRDKGLQIHNRDGIIMHDWWLALIASYFGKISYISDPQILYRQHGDNSVGAKNITSVKYISKVFTKRDEVKVALKKTQVQAGVFVNTFNIQDKMLQSYAELSKKNKISRLGFYIKNHVWKSELLRNIGLIIFG